MMVKIWEVLKKHFLVSIFFLYLVFRMILFTPVFSDETIYINMAKAVSNGLLPYKDFFYAHPPIQLFLLAPFAYFGNFFLIKMLISMIGFSCLFLTYLIAKEIFGYSSAVVSFLFFLFFPGFLIFGNLAMGSFEALFFFLLSLYLVLKKRFFLSAVLLVISIFTRYLILLLIPFLLIYVFKYFRKNFNYFLVCIVLVFSFFFLLFYIMFGKNFLVFTIFYHFHSNIDVFRYNKETTQYLSLGLFTTFLSLISTVYGYLEKDSKILLFSSYSLFYDTVLLLVLTYPIYHYFVFVLPLVFIGCGATFVKSKLKLTKLFFITVMFLSLIANVKSLNIYFNKKENLILHDLINYTLENTNSSDLIFGSAIPINFVSFVTNRRIVNNYFDSDPKFISFYGREKILEEIKNSKPKIIIGGKEYVDFFLDDYEVVKEIKKDNYYHLFLLKRR